MRCRTDLIAIGIVYRLIAKRIKCMDIIERVICALSYIRIICLDYTIGVELSLCKWCYSKSA